MYNSPWLKKKVFPGIQLFVLTNPSNAESSENDLDLSSYRADDATTGICLHKTHIQSMITPYKNLLQALKQSWVDVSYVCGLGQWLKGR